MVVAGDISPIAKDRAKLGSSGFHIIETKSSQVPRTRHGFLPDALGSVLAVVSGIAVYLFGAFVALLAQFVSILVFGVTPPHMDALYTVAGFGLIVTVAVQYNVTGRIRSSKWYLGY